jgi:serine/threonine-protein kinase
MGEVWRAHDTVIDRTVAIKMLLPHFAQDRTFEQRFRREARAAARLDEPHVVPIYDVGEIDGRLYVAMRLINGQDLQTLLCEGPLGPDRAVRITEQIASALDAAHKAGLVHRDVKPSNILLTDEDFAYLIDFGIARAVGETGLTSTGATIGTWSYMAPERFKSGEIKPNSDIYALACVLYQSLTGQLPFPGTTLEQVAMAHMTVPPPKPSTQRRAIPMAMDDVIAIGLAKDPRQRYPTAKELANAARAALNHAQNDTLRAPAPGQPITESVPNGSRRRWLASGAALAVILLAGGIALAWRPWEHQPTSTSSESPGPSSLTTPPPQATPMTTTASPPPPPIFSPKAIDQVLLTAGQLSNLLGVDVTNNPAGGGGGSALAIKTSSYGTSDHSAQVKPQSCVGVAFTGEHDVYAPENPVAIKIQVFGEQYGGSGGSSAAPYYVEQTAAIFSSAEQAQQILKSSQAQWSTCGRGEVDVTLGYENGRSFRLGNVEREGDLITISMASWGGLNGLHACQQALGVRANVVVEARTCEVPSVPNFNWQDPVNPAWASPTAAPLANAMLNKVTT